MSTPTPSDRLQALALELHNRIISAPCSLGPSCPGLQEIVALLESAAEPHWHDISSAPKDGTMILVVEPKESRHRLAVYHEPWIMWLSVPGRIMVRPTHWLPLPKGPKP